MAAAKPLLYFEASWSILSSIGLINLLFGLMVGGITNFSPITLVPIVVSIAIAIGNGLAFYCFFEKHSARAILVGGIFADLFWLIQEAGLSFYSYMILRRVLRGRGRMQFLILFWLFITSISAIRVAIMVVRAMNVYNTDNALHVLVAHLHIGYFVGLALVEILSAFFLLRTFNQAKKDSDQIAGKTGLFHYLTQSTEVRLATLAIIGVSRTITFAFQNVLTATDVMDQIDRFVFTLECMFPIIMYIDILASRIATISHSQATHSNNGNLSRPYGRSRTDKDVKMYSMSRSKSRPGNHMSGMSSSQERIVGEDEMGVKSIVETTDGRHSPTGSKEERGINKTVEVNFHSVPV